jgi:CheY-like chemotaxis protein
VAMNLEVISRQLEAYGMGTKCVEDGFAAIAELERAWHMGKPYDVVFLDQMMPGMSGDDLAAHIRKSPNLRDAKLIMVSSAGLNGIKRETLPLLDAKIEKPLRQHELLDCLIRLHGVGQPVRASAEKLTSGGAQAGQPVHGLKILVAEDNKINQKYADALLSNSGHTVHMVENGLQAVDAVRRDDYDVVLMDIQMPELDGIGATREIRALSKPKCNIPIIALTANAMTGDEKNYLEAGMDAYVSKPIRPVELFQKLAQVVVRPAAGNAKPECQGTGKDKLLQSAL